MDVIVPFAVDDPKSRLEPVLAPDERREFARAMLADVLDAVVTAGGSPHVLATAPFDPTADRSGSLDPPVVVDDRPLTDAVNAALERHGHAAAGPTAEPRTASSSRDGVAVVMADLALATPGALARLFEPDRDGDRSDEPPADVTIAPGRGGGTNALVVRQPAFRVDYHGASYLDHRRVAERLDATARVVDSYRLAVDVDEPADLAEVLLHGSGAAEAWLRDAGFTLDTADGRVTATRA
ncbi:2-phospho-L-lactate guanylyltransferase [Halorubrum sp. SY-15]|jgi:2-phospho-L-lactate guanylyltransferase|uniref:2-phospho-L-lactate guanylyltransferase n=1 Tax=Halorubrum sp. SY-15 TaxID=3402277 RepID=UPI003EB6C474